MLVLYLEGGVLRDHERGTAPYTREPQGRKTIIGHIEHLPFLYFTKYRIVTGLQDVTNTFFMIFLKFQIIVSNYVLI